jgi:hypothetical protein
LWLPRIVEHVGGIAARLSVTLLQHYTILSAGMTTTSGHLRELEPTIALRPEDSVGLADWRNPKGLPSDLPRKTVSRWDAKGIIVGVSACMTAGREPSNQSFEIDSGRRFA